jgi:hypothetical protein
VEVHDAGSACPLALRLDGDEGLDAADERRVDRERDGAGVVDRRPAEAPEVEVGRAEERDPADDRARDVAVERAQALDDRRRRERLVGQVEPDHRDRDAAGEDLLGGLRVDPDVELGVRGAVAAAGRAAHDDDLAQRAGELRMARQRARDVRQRPDGDERDRLGRRGRDVGDEPVRRARVERDVGLGQVVAVERRRAVHVGRRLQRADERALGAGCHRDVADPGQRADAQRVPGDLVELAVAGDGRDRAEVELRARGGEQQRDRVVVAGVAVDDARPGHQPAADARPGTRVRRSATRGRELWGPSGPGVVSRSMRGRC